MASQLIMEEREVISQMRFAGHKRQAVARLSYGEGAVAPAHRVEYPEIRGFPVRLGHKTVTNGVPAEKDLTQVAAG